jgi:hypothetical protein
LAAAFRVLAGIRRLQGDLIAADQLLADSEPLSGVEDLDVGVYWFDEWAVVAAGLGDIERAHHLAAVALATATQLAYRYAVADALWAEGEVLLAAGEQAADSYTRAITCMGTHSMPLRRVEALTGLALSVDDADVAATATAAATTIRDEQHMVLPAAISARLDENAQRWASIIGAEQWTQRLEALTTRPHDELLHLLVGDRAAPPS